MTIELHGEAPPPAAVSGPPSRLAPVALAVGLVALAAAWVPGLGLALGGGALALAVAARRRGGTGPLVLGGVATALGLAFTLAYGACTPTGAVEPLEPWPSFDGAFGAAAAR